MDILHMTIEDIGDMDLMTYQTAVDYSWNAYLHRRVDYWIAKAFGEEGKGSDKTKNIDWSPINPVSQQLKKDRMNRQRTIPPKFLENMNK